MIQDLRIAGAPLPPAFNLCVRHRDRTALHAQLKRQRGPIRAQRDARIFFELLCFWTVRLCDKMKPLCIDGLQQHDAHRGSSSRIGRGETDDVGIGVAPSRALPQATGFSDRIHAFSSCGRRYLDTDAAREAAARCHRPVGNFPGWR